MRLHERDPVRRLQAVTKLPPTSFTATLRDGTVVLVRPIRPDDKSLIREGLTRLSDRSRYRRFVARVRELTEDQLRYLTEIDFENHMAWAALEPDELSGRGLGIARYVRLADDPAAAEVAVTVVDSHQGRGLGTILLSALARTARENGIEEFVAHVLTENAPVLRIAREAGARVLPEGRGIVRLAVPVPRSSDEIPDTPAGRVFKAVARQMGG